MRRDGAQHQPYQASTGAPQQPVFAPTYYTIAPPPGAPPPVAPACCFHPPGAAGASDASSSMQAACTSSTGPPLIMRPQHHSGPAAWGQYPAMQAPEQQPGHSAGGGAGWGGGPSSSSATADGRHHAGSSSAGGSFVPRSGLPQHGGGVGRANRGATWGPGGPSSSMGCGPQPGCSPAYFGYAAVPCIMVPTGEPVFYTHITTSPSAPGLPPAPGMARHQPAMLALPPAPPPPPAPPNSTSSSTGYQHPPHAYAVPPPPPPHAFYYTTGSPCMHGGPACVPSQMAPRQRKFRAMPYGLPPGSTGNGGPVGLHQHVSTEHSLSGSRSVSSFSSTGFYALVDSASEASHDQPGGGARLSSGSSGSQRPPVGPHAILQHQPSLQGSVSGASGISTPGSSSTGAAAAAAVEEVTSWGDLTVGILQNIICKLVDAEIKQMRQVCRHWRGAVDHNLDALTPSSLMSKLITMRFPNLKLLHLTNCTNVRNRDLQLLSTGGLRLHTLTLGDDANRPWVSNIGLAWIGRVTTLTALNLQDCTQVTNRGLLFLQQLTGLAALSLKGCNKVNNMGLEGLRHNTALTSLNLTGCTRVSDKGLLPLTALPSLMSLHLGSTRVKDEGMEYLARITTLHDLHFARESMTDTGLLQLSTLTNLQTLALRECPQVTGDSLSALVPQLSNLQSLDLFQSYAFDDAQLAKCLDFLGSVTFLDLRGTVVSEEGIQQLVRLQNLQKLCLAPQAEVQVEQQLCVVSHLTQLTSLAINNCRLVSFDLMSSLAHLKLLRELDISNNGQTMLRPADVAIAREPVNDGAIQAMGNITSLTSIDLSRRSVHDEQLSTLAERLPKLRTLFVVGCPVLYETLQALHRRFPELIIHRKPLHDSPAISCSSSEHNFY